MKPNQIIIGLIFISLMIIGILFLIYHSTNQSTINNFANNEVSEIYECQNNSDCVIGGCSAELCVNSQKRDDIASICVWRDEYACYQHDDCLCLDNKCQWEGNDSFRECINLLSEN